MKNQRPILRTCIYKRLSGLRMRNSNYIFGIIGVILMVFAESMGVIWSTEGATRHPTPENFSRQWVDFF